MVWFSCSVSYLRNKTDILSAQYIGSCSHSDTSRHLQFGKVTCSVTVSRQWTQFFTNPSEDSQAWKKCSYLDEGSARGTEWDNRRRIQCTVACIESDSNTAPFTEGNQIWQSCVKILICLERISAPYFCEKMEINADSSMSVLYIPNI